MPERLAAVLGMLARIGEYAYESLLVPPLDAPDHEAERRAEELSSQSARGDLFDQPDLIR
jgi:hypothetical protein